MDSAGTGHIVSGGVGGGVIGGSGNTRQGNNPNSKPNGTVTFGRPRGDDRRSAKMKTSDGKGGGLHVAGHEGGPAKADFSLCWRARRVHGRG